MTEWFFAITGALWFGILTSISPCPLATNIAAISFIGRKVDRPAYTLLTGLLYTLGRTAAYLILGIILVQSLLSVPVLAHWLQKYMHRLLGPILILVAMMLLGLLNFSSKGSGLGQWCQNRADKFGIAGGFLLGFLFAMSFCPVSAGLFFGSLLTLAVKHNSPVLLPAMFGVGTALPVVVFAIVIATSANAVGRAFEKITQFELWARRITGIVFMAVGFYFTFAYTLGFISG